MWKQFKEGLKDMKNRGLSTGEFKRCNVKGTKGPVHGLSSL